MRVAGAIVEQFGDAEVEQLDLGLRIDQQVRGFDVAVHDELRVRMRDRPRRLHEQAQPRGHAEPALLAVTVDALPVDRLECQVGLAIGGDTGVVQACDVRVVECGEDLALARDAHRQIAAKRSMRQLERDAALHQPVGAVGEPHHAHAADTKLAHQPVGPDGVARSVAPRSAVGGAGVARVELGQCAQQGIGFDLRCARQQFAQRVGQIGMLRWQGREPGSAVLRWQVERIVEQGADTRPGFLVDAEALFHPVSAGAGPPQGD